MFCAATLLLGSSMAFTQQYRFAAAESAPPERLSQAVSYVLVGSLGAAIVNPQLALAARWLIPGTQYAGSFVAVSMLYAATIAVLSRLHVPAPSVPRPPAASDAPRTPFATPQFRMAVFAGACAYAVMSFVMTAAPISMHHVDHHDVEATTWVVQSHVLSMYLPSLFTGHVIARFGERNVMIWGGALLASLRGRQPVRPSAHALLARAGRARSRLESAVRRRHDLALAQRRSGEPPSRAGAERFRGVRLASVRVAAGWARRTADRLAGAESRHVAAAGGDDLHREPPAARSASRPRPCAPFLQSRARERRVVAADPLARRAAHRPHRSCFSRRSGQRRLPTCCTSRRSTRVRITRWSPQA